jgi:NAD(P)-dependent dehydrogenase (short-subunit alcohol dehydrogenase family)
LQHHKERTINFLIIGYGGIAKALTKIILATTNNYVTVISREHHPDITYSIKADCCDAKQAIIAMDQLKATPDVVINTIGALHEGKRFWPEKSLEQLKIENLIHAVTANTMPFANICQAMTKHINPDKKIKFITLGARVGSISDNRLGGWHSYRMSKCALHMLMRNIAIEWRHKHPNAVVCGYHPGTIQTELSKPFLKSVNPEKLFSPETGAQHLLNFIGSIDQSHSGNLYDWQGSKLEF